MAIWGWKPCDECPNGGGDSGPPGPYDYDYGYDGWLKNPRRDDSGGDGDNGDGDGDGDDGGDGDHDEDQKKRRKHCFGSGEFLGDSRYYRGLVGLGAAHVGMEVGAHVLEHGLRAPVVTQWIVVPFRNVIGPLGVYEGLYAIPRETCEQMYPD